MRSFKISVVKFLTLAVAMLMLGTMSTFAQVNVTVPSVAGTTGQEKIVNIKVSNLTGQDVKSFQFFADYDKSVFTVLEVITDGTLLEGKPDPEVNNNSANGKLNVAWANSSALSGTGTLLKLKVKFGSLGASALGFNGTFQFNTGTPAIILDNGTIATVDLIVSGGDVQFNKGADIKIPISVATIKTTDNVVAYEFNAAFDKSVISITGYELEGTLSAVGGADIKVTDGTLKFAWASGTKISGAGVLVYLTGKALVPGVSPITLSNWKFNQGNPTAALEDGMVTVAAFNTAPVLTLTPAGPFTVAENATLAIALSGTDADGDVLTFSAVDMPTGATLNATTGAFSWKPTYAQAGVYTVKFKVSDGTSTDTKDGVITVTDVNHAPTLTINPEGSISVNEGSVLKITLNGVDTDTDNTLTYTSTTIEGASITGNVFTWVINYTQSGAYILRFKAVDNKGAESNSVTILVTVNDVNRAPQFTKYLAPNQVVPVHNVPVEYSFTFEGSDPDEDALLFALEAGPDGSSMTSNGVFTWTPKANQAEKSYTVRVSLSDGTNIVYHQSVVVGSALVGVELETGIPSEFKLLQNYPNPFNPTTNIRFGLPKESSVRLTVFNILGQEVAVLVNNTLPAGFHKVSFNAANLNTGMYIYKIEADNFVSVKKMLFVK